MVPASNIPLEGYRLRGRGRLVLWPAYLDAEYSRRERRLVPRNLALRGVKVDEMFQAALELGLNPELRAGAAHPRRPWRKRGVVLVDKTGPKTRVVRALAREIRARRGLK